MWERYLREAKRLLQIPHINTWWQTRKHAYTQSCVDTMNKASPAPARKLANEVIVDMINAEIP